MANLSLSTTELARILKVTPVTVFRWIKQGKIKAHKMGKNYRVFARDIGGLVTQELTSEQKEFIDGAVKKAIHEYGIALKLLGKE